VNFLRGAVVDPSCSSWFGYLNICFCIALGVLCGNALP